MKKGIVGLLLGQLPKAPSPIEKIPLTKIHYMIDLCIYMQSNLQEESLVHFGMGQ
jgi:hypothetical protein